MGSKDEWIQEMEKQQKLLVEWFEDFERGAKKFTGFRWENRYRIFQEQVPLNPMVYMEYEDLDPATRYKMEVSGWVNPPYAEGGGEPDRERILETRLVLSQDFGSLNFSLNWINETDLANAETAFGYALGGMWMIHDSQEENEHHSHESHEGSKGAMGVGLELYGALGDTQSFGFTPSRQEHYLGPILMYHFSQHWMFHTQLAIGLSKTSDNLVRLNFGYEF